MVKLQDKDMLQNLDRLEKNKYKNTDEPEWRFSGRVGRTGLPLFVLRRNFFWRLALSSSSCFFSKIRQSFSTRASSAASCEVSPSFLKMFGSTILRHNSFDETQVHLFKCNGKIEKMLKVALRENHATS